MKTKRKKIVVYHSSYGCDSGCCGHVIKYEDDSAGTFDFSHPKYKEDPKKFAKRLVEETFGAEHVKDLDWNNCRISDD